MAAPRMTLPTAPTASHAAPWLAGGGEMGERMRALDWSTTALGPVEGWRQSLRSTVSTCIGSRFPMVLYWGPQRVVPYNDAYAEFSARSTRGRSAVRARRYGRKSGA